MNPKYLILALMLSSYLLSCTTVESDIGEMSYAEETVEINLVN